MRFSLVIGNKNYSSWSMRPWVLMRQYDIPFKEIRVRFDSFDRESDFKRQVLTINPVGTVPVLLDHEREGLAVGDSLAISDYLAECFPDRNLWPADPVARARAHSICAEMHSGFWAMRSMLAMNIEAHLPAAGQLVLRDHAAVRADVARLTNMWTELLLQSGGPMLFGEFSIADAYYAPVCMRMYSYEIPLPTDVKQYVNHVRQLVSVRQWIKEAEAEHDFVPMLEPYRLHR